ncbi:MAG: hypothetical protein SFU83_02790 [Meiothermus sp.]|nr:hypothetical protein [Meiothermus sp.]
MTHVIKVFWLFFFATVLSGGLLGRFVAAFFQGEGNWGLGLASFLMAVLFVVSLTLLVRVLRADALARRKPQEGDRA